MCCWNVLKVGLLSIVRIQLPGTESKVPLCLGPGQNTCFWKISVNMKTNYHKNKFLCPD